MRSCDTCIREVQVIDGSGSEPYVADVAFEGDAICGVGSLGGFSARTVIRGEGMALAPGFIDVHTHDDLEVIRNPGMLAKLSQGVTSVVVGNCGISAAPVRLTGEPPDPMNLLGSAAEFQYPEFAAYTAAVRAVSPATNVAALVGHTSLRNNCMDRLDRVATKSELEWMRAQLRAALEQGAFGLSTGLAYKSANAATTEEVLALGELLAEADALYTTHLRSEADTILDAMNEAFLIGRQCKVPVVISHLKCAGIANWGRSGEVLQRLDAARAAQPVSCDCYPYAASSSTLDLRQVDERIQIMITWSNSHPELAGRTLAEIAAEWRMSQREAAQRLQPAGAIYHGIFEDDMRSILRHPATMIGSDGLPGDPRPHPRLWGTFPRVLGLYSRELRLLPLSVAVHKMTGMPASRFGLAGRGLIREGHFADVVLFQPELVRDAATFANSTRKAEGIAAVWVNGVGSYKDGQPAGAHGGRLLSRAVRSTHGSYDAFQPQ